MEVIDSGIIGSSTDRSPAVLGLDTVQTSSLETKTSYLGNAVQPDSKRCRSSSLPEWISQTAAFTSSNPHEAAWDHAASPPARRSKSCHVLPHPSAIVQELLRNAAPPLDSDVPRSYLPARRLELEVGLDNVSKGQSSRSKHVLIAVPQQSSFRHPICWMRIRPSARVDS